jgi:hypothetical protein
MLVLPRASENDYCDMHHFTATQPITWQSQANDTLPTMLPLNTVTGIYSSQQVSVQSTE